MAKKNKEEPNLFDNPTFNEFEIEGEEKKEVVVESNSFNIESADVKNEVKSEEAKSIIPATQQVTSEIKKDTIESFKIISQPLVEKALKFITINNDDENTFARDLAKELDDMKKKIDAEKKKRNKPLKDEIDSNTEKAKNLIEPLDTQILRLKTLVTTYELEKEKKRKAELERLEKEQKEREEKERLDRERISKIRNEIGRLRELSSKSIGDASTTDALNKIQINLTNWKPKQEFFMEFFDEVNVNLRKEFQALIDGRTPIVKDLEEQRKKTAELELQNKEAADREKKLLEEKLAAEKKQKEQDAAMAKAREDSEELSARNELTVLVASLGIKEFEPYLENIITKYGNCREAAKKRDEIVKNYQDEQERLRQVANLDSQKIKNQRVDYIFTIDDETKVPVQFFSVDEAKIKKAIQENRALLEKDINAYKIEGVTISTKVQTVLKK